MPHDPLTIVLRLRRQSLEAAQQDLARATAAETDAGALVRLAETMISDEQDAACAITASDGAVEAFSRWLPGARQRAESARAMLERTQAEVGRTRAMLTAARTALESIETLAQQRMHALEQERARLEERELEESCRPRSIMDQPQQ